MAVSYCLSNHEQGYQQNTSAKKRKRKRNRIDTAKGGLAGKRTGLLGKAGVSHRMKAVGTYSARPFDSQLGCTSSVSTSPAAVAREHGKERKAVFQSKLRHLRRTGQDTRRTALFGRRAKTCSSASGSSPISSCHQPSLPRQSNQSACVASPSPSVLPVSTASQH